MRLRHWIMVCVALLIAVVIALGRRDGNPSLIKPGTRPVSRVFDGFAYAGEDLQKNTYHVNRFLPFRLRTMPLPQELASGHDYYFHRPVSAEQSSTDIAREVLAPRLRQEGFHLTENAGGDVLMGLVDIDYTDGGTTLWSIRFTRNGCSGEVSHDFDHGIARNPWSVVHKTWDEADYILTVKGNCGL